MEEYLRKWLVKWHGEGAPHQAEFYRCLACSHLVRWKNIYAGDACCAGRMSPTTPRFWERIRLLVFPWTY